MEVKERVIDLREFLKFLLEKKYIIILFMILLVGSVCGVYLYKQKINANSLDSEIDEMEGDTSLQEIIAQNHDAYYHLNDVTAFSDASQPAGTYNSSVRLFVDFDFSSIEGNSNLDFSQMINKLQQDSLLIFVCDESLKNVINELDLTQYDDMSEFTSEDLSWLINKNYLGANVLQVVVTDTNPERAQAIIDALVSEFIEKAKQVDTIDSVTIIDDARSVRTGVVGTKKIQKTQGELSLKKLLKYLIVGGIGVLSILIVVLFAIFLIKDAVRTSADVETVNLTLFGEIKNKKNKIEDYKRIAYSIALYKDCKNLLFVPVDKYSENKEVYDKVKEELLKVDKSINVYFSKNINESADAILEAAKMDAIIILAFKGKTKMEELQFAKTEMDKTGKKILGTILDN